MYSKSFYITEPVWNNALSFEKRKNPQLYIPSLKKIENFDEIKLLTSPQISTLKGHRGPLKGEREAAKRKKVTFEDYGFEWGLQTCYGLENLYEMSWKWRKLYLVDNHNHVFYFWYLARAQGIISDNSLLYHIDEHADTRDPWEYLLKPDSQDSQKVFDYTNHFLNVGNYIIPAEKEGLIWETIQIRSENALEEYLQAWTSPQPSPFKGEGEATILSCQNDRSIILNLDLDFFSLWLDYIGYELKKKVILDIAQKADLITVCTSPFFIEQERALEVFRDLFYH